MAQIAEIVKIKSLFIFDCLFYDYSIFSRVGI